jgi:hypothetical protein
MLMFLGHTAGQQMFVGENNGCFYNHHKVINYLIGKKISCWYFLSFFKQIGRSSAFHYS